MTATLTTVDLELDDQPAARAQEAPTANILIADDDPAGLLALETVLADLRQNVVKAASGEQALRCLLAADFAVIVLDVRMPGMDGFETARFIRQRKRTEHTPIIFLTGASFTDDEMFTGYSVGAVDYLTKPVPPRVLKAKVTAFVELFRKTEEVKRQAEQLREFERREHARELAEAQAHFESERLRQELRIAAGIQQKLFPAGPPECPGFDIYGASQPAEVTGGDYFDYIPAADGTLAIVIADVCGHGFGPALLMAATRSYLRALVLEQAADVERILRLTNRALNGDVAEGRFVTLLLVRLDPARRSLVCAGAGHPPGYVLNSRGEVKEILRSGGIPLGILADGAFPAQNEIILDPGDLVLLITDGVLETMAPDGSQFGAERALAVVRDNHGKSARDIVHLLYHEIMTFAHPCQPLDDVTAIVIKVNATNREET